MQSQTDTLVVGARYAGSVMARELAERAGHRVLLRRRPRAVGLHRLETRFVGFMDGDDAPLSGASA